MPCLRQQQGQHTEENQSGAERSGDFERRVGKRENALCRVPQQPAQIPLALTDAARDILVLDPARPKTDISKDPFRVAIVFPQLQDRVRHAAPHHTEVPFSACCFHAGQPVPDFIESARQAGADFTFARAAAAARAAQIKSAAAVTQDSVHSGQQCRRVLQIGVHQYQIIAGRFPQSGEHRRLLAEVA